MTADEVAQAYAQFGPSVLRRCRRLLGEAALAEDALQEVFTRLFRYGDAYRSADSKLLWLYRVADRCSFDILARRRAPSGAPADEPSADQAALLEYRDGARRLLGRFDGRVRRAAILYYVDELSLDQIAREVGWSRKTLARKLERLRERAQVMRGRLAREVP